MGEREHDIEFDFFEDFEPAPAVEDERTKIVRRPGGGPPSGGGPHRPSVGTPPAGLTPLLRLAGLIAFAILVIVLLVFWVKSCQSSGKTHAYTSYMQKIGDVGADSQRIGHDVTVALTTPGLKITDLSQKLAGLAQQQQQDVARAQSITPPGTLRSEQSSAIEALQFRVGGLQGLSDTFRANAASKDASGTGVQLAAQAQRLTTSDVVWADLFKTPSAEELNRQGVHGVTVPDSTFSSDPNFASPAYWQQIFQRLAGSAATGGGGCGAQLHGTGLISVKALPSGKVLDSTAADNTVTATTDLGFAVTVQDTGDSQEVSIPVTLTIQQQPTPIVRTLKIDQINPGEQHTLEFKNFTEVQFATKTQVKVDVKPVACETRTQNNSAVYQVIFTLG